MSGCSSKSEHVCKQSAILGKLQGVMRISQLPWPKLLQHALIAGAFNCGIAAAITAFGSQSFAQNILYSQLIGLSIWSLIDIGRHLLHADGKINPSQAVALTLVGSVAGYFIGSAAGDLLLGHPVLLGWQRAPKAMLGFLIMSLVAGCVLVYFFMSREVLQLERAERERAERQAAEAQLKLLQSQLEPHMLFNTLANLRALIGSDAARATGMLDKLVDFLRATLSASRTSEHSLQAEFARLGDYLALMQIRMGPRLRFELQLPHELSGVQVPSLILQSLVENAVLHGLEPTVEGGKVIVSAAREGEHLLLQVQDDGLGCDASELREGFGLAQVRQRLASRYSSAGSIKFIANNDYSIRTYGQLGIKNTGCSVQIRIPMSGGASAHVI
jgi:signal transduction histidine kinase